MSAPRPLLSVFLALLLAVRLASPWGFMPGEAGGRFALVECPDAIPIPSAHHGTDHGAKAKPLCPFATGMAAAGPLPQAAALPAPPPWPATLRLAPDVSVPVARAAFLRPPSRAPPAA
jgi:hypothetical protein